MSEELTGKASDGLIALPAIQDLANTYKLSAKAFAYTFRAVAMPSPHTEAEFVSCCLVAKEHGLNPLTKEIYFMRTRAGAIQPIVAVDGWIKKCNEHPQFDGMELEDDCNEAGELQGMYCTIYRKDRSRPTRIREDFAECKAAGGPVWKTSGYRMMRNRVICQCARIAFGFAGIMDRDEFEQWQELKDVTPAAARPAPSLPEIPDIPDPAEPPPVAVEAPAEETQIDVEEFLSDLRSEREWCTSEQELQELRDARIDTIDALPAAARTRALKILDIEE